MRRCAAGLLSWLTASVTASLTALPGQAQPSKAQPARAEQSQAELGLLGAEGAIQLRISECATGWASTIRDLAALELAPRALVLVPGRPDDSALTTAVLQCQGGRARVTVRAARRPVPLVLELDLEATAAAARPRLLALTLSELIVTSQMESQGPAEPEAAQPEPQGTPSDAAVERPRDPMHVWLAAGAGYLGTPAMPVPLFAAGLFAGLGTFGLVADVEGAFGGQTRPAGEVAMWAASAGLGAAAALQLSRAWMRLGMGVRVGYTSLSGVSQEVGIQGRRLGGPWFGPMLRLGLHVPLLGRLALHSSLEVGWVTVTVKGFDTRDRDLFALGGFRLAAALGLGLAL